MKKEIFLSFSPKWYNPLEEGSKKFEYRRRFCNEGVLAYIYLSYPIQKVVAKIKFGKKVPLETWKEKYSNNKEVLTRINDYLLRNKYVIPIMSFQKIKPISLNEIRESLPSFNPPMSYMYIKEKSKLQQLLECQEPEKQKITHSFKDIELNSICVD